MEDEQATTRQAYPRGRGRKIDPAPRGVRRHPSGVWAIRYTCGAGHKHKEKVGPIKQDGITTYHARRKKAHDEPGWCPTTERRLAGERTAAERTRAQARVTFAEYATEYLEWAKLHHRGWETEASRIKAMNEAFGEAKLDGITVAEVERFLDGLLQERSQSTRNRYRTLLHAMLNRAIRHGRLTVNPVQGVGKFKEPEGRTLYLLSDEEAVVRDALRPESARPATPGRRPRAEDLRPLFTVSVHTGLRWSEQIALRWIDVDVLTRLLSVTRSKNGRSRKVPMNSVVRSVLMDLAGQRQRPDDPEEPVFRCSYTAPDKFFPRAVESARKALTAAGRDGGRLHGYTWHCNRHSFASRLVMAGVDLRTVQELGGWRSLAMVQRYSHLDPAHLHAAVERLVGQPSGATNGVVEVSRKCPAPEPAPAGVS